MELDDKILENAAKVFGLTKEEAKQQLQEMIDEGLLETNTDPSVPFKYKTTTSGARLAEQTLKENFGEFKKVFDHNGIAYKVPIVVIAREGIREDELKKFPLWEEGR